MHNKNLLLPLQVRIMDIELAGHYGYRRIVKSVLPSIGMVLITSIYSIVDGFFVSNFAGKSGFAAVNLMWPSMMILGSLGLMVGSGGAALVSKVKGEGYALKANRIFSLLVKFLVVMGVLAGALYALFAPTLARWFGADEFINNRPRWVLYLGNATPAELHAMPHCMKILQQVRQYRMASDRKQTQKAALTPNKFGLEVIPKENYMIVPVVSSERRLYVPMGFMSPDVMCSNQVNLIPDATLYHFGVLESSVHMAWMRAVCGRLEMRYRYSKDIVYNNFPWPEPTEEQKARIEQTAQAILDARALFPDSSLADLYDDLTMPPQLRKAHQDNDRAVMQAYGFDPKATTESQCIASLFSLYHQRSEK